MLSRAAILALLASAAVAGVLAGSASAGPMRTGIVEPQHFGAGNPVAFDRTKATGASVVRLIMQWNGVAQTGPPADPTNPADPSYDWAPFDSQARLAAERNLDIIAVIIGAPKWAEGAGSGPVGGVRPNPMALGHFAMAAARRYSGSFAGLPRIRNWQVWNEPNRTYFLMPQFERGVMVSAPHYRAMVNAVAASVKRVNAGNLVVAGGLAPLGQPGKPAPLAFMREMLCVSRTLARSCDLRARPAMFDVWSHHPYTSGGPTHSAQARDDVALGDLPEMRQVLRAAARLGHVRSARPLQFWVTEFSWDTSPPDPRAVGMALHARWTAEALYRMWQNGVSLVTWFRIQDDSLAATPYQSGFYTVAGARKRSFTAFRFPLVAFTKSNGVYVWGRTPTSRSASVVVEIKSGRRWRRLGTVRAPGSGVFQKTFRTPYRKGSVRARAVGEVSLPFSLTPVRNRYVNPFGCGGGIPC